MAMKTVSATPFMLAKLADGQNVTIAVAELVLVPNEQIKKQPVVRSTEAPLCLTCGMLMTPNGACWKCENCGGTSGCS